MRYLQESQLHPIVTAGENILSFPFVPSFFQAPVPEPDPSQIRYPYLF